MKKERLYTVNKYNKQAFNRRRYDDGGPLNLESIENATLGNSMNNGSLSVDATNLNMLSLTNQLHQEKGLDLPKGGSSALGTIGGIAQAASGPIAGLIGGGYSSGAGSALQGLSSVASAIPGPYGAIASATLNVAGGLANRAFGMKVNQEKLNAANQGTDYLKGFTSNASSFDNVQGPQSMANVQNAYKGGWFSGGKARRKNNALRQKRTAAQQFADNSVQNNINNLKDTQMNNALANYAAFGGPLDIMPDINSATGYGFMTDYLNIRNQQVQGKNSTTPYLGNVLSTPMTYAKGGKIHIKKSHEGLFTEQAKRAGMGVQEYAAHVLAHKDQYPASTIKRANFARNAAHWHGEGGLLDTPTYFNGNPTFFALGGDLQANGGDYGTGLTHISAGGTHEESPYGGVPYGVAQDEEPNLVEEGETVFEDYVFSNRIKPTADVLKRFHLYSKNSQLTYADVSKKLEKEASERPNDPISLAALRKQMEQLAEAQEQQKQAEEAERAREAFEALSPEEQQQVLAQIAAQQQGAEEQAAQEEVAQQEMPQEAMEQPTYDEAMQMQQPMEEGSMSAYGGPLQHVFDKGGGIAFRNNLLKAMGFHTISRFNDWWKRQGGDPEKLDWEALSKNPQNLDFSIIAKKNAALADALKSGYDFGVYKPQTNGYDLTGFNKSLSQYAPSKIMGKNDGKYAIDQDFMKNYYGDQYKDIKALEGSEAYQNYTKALLNTMKAAQGLRFKLDNGTLTNIDGQTYTPENLALLNTLWNTVQGTATAPGELPVPMFVDQGDGTFSLADNAQELLVGADGKSGLRYDGHGGIFHLTPTASVPTNQVVNRVMKADGTVEDIIGDIPKEWGKSIYTYQWNNPTNGFTYNYYQEPAEKAAASTEEERKIPYDRNEKLRYAGLLGPAVGLGLWSAGVGKPDYSGLETALSISNQPVEQVRFSPVGNYLSYRPMDIWAAQNRMDANSRATDRALTDNNAPVATKMAGLLANGYNSQLGAGQLYRQALEYNDAQRQRVADFNRATDEYNAEGAYRADAANAQMRNSARQATAQMAANIAAQRMNADAAWNNALYGNISGLFEGISNLGREAAQRNMISATANSGAYGNLSDEMINHSYGQYKSKKRAKGGKLRKKRGYTF